MAQGVLGRVSQGNSPAIDFESVLREPGRRLKAPGSAVGPLSSGSDRWGVYTPGRAPTGQMLDSSTAAVAPPAGGRAVAPVPEPH